MTDTRKAALTIAAIAAFEGIFVILNFVASGPRFLNYLGFRGENTGSVLGWIVALMVTAVFVTLSLRLPSVRQNLFRPSGLKLLAVALAVFAGILEELVFRKLLMDTLDKRGDGVMLQIGASAFAFGAMHAVWGLLGRSFRAAIGAGVATGLLGAALASVYVASSRSLAPCVVAHFLINLLIEPGLVLAAMRGEMTERTNAP